MEGKSVNESKTEQVQIITQSDLNGYGRLFGGQLMKWIDIVKEVLRIIIAVLGGIGGSAIVS